MVGEREKGTTTTEGRRTVSHTGEMFTIRVTQQKGKAKQASMTKETRQKRGEREKVNGTVTGYHILVQRPGLCVFGLSYSSARCANPTDGLSCKPRLGVPSAPSLASSSSKSTPGSCG